MADSSSNFTEALSFLLGDVCEAIQALHQQHVEQLQQQVDNSREDPLSGHDIPEFGLPPLERELRNHRRVLPGAATPRVKLSLPVLLSPLPSESNTRGLPPLRPTSAGIAFPRPNLASSSCPPSSTIRPKSAGARPDPAATVKPEQGHHSRYVAARPRPRSVERNIADNGDSTASIVTVPKPNCIRRRLSGTFPRGSCSPGSSRSTVVTVENRHCSLLSVPSYIFPVAQPGELPQQEVFDAVSPTHPDRGDPRKSDASMLLETGPSTSSIRKKSEANLGDGDHELSSVRSAPLHEEEDGEHAARTVKFKILGIWDRLLNTPGVLAAQKSSTLKRTSRMKSMMAPGSILSSQTRSFDPACCGTRDLSDIQIPGSSMQRFMLKPSSATDVLLDCIAVCLIIQDMIVFPLLFFEADMIKFVNRCFAWISSLFWLADIARSFMTGYLDDEGLIQWQLSRVGMRYARTWLPLDLLCTAASWMELVLGASDSGSKELRILFSLQFARLLRLAKAVKVERLILERLRTEQLRLLVQMVRSTMMILVFAHIMACLTHGASRQCRSVEESVHEASFLDAYVHNLHSSVATMGGEVVLPPSNTCERLFATVSYVSFFLMSIFFGSIITTSLTRLAVLTSTQASQLFALRRYLSDHRISTSLAVRVQRNVQHVLDEEQKDSKTSLELLKLISEPLREELLFEQHAPVLVEHPLFLCCSELNRAVITRLCRSAVRSSSMLAGDCAFVEGDSPTHPCMYFVMDGTLLYHQSADEDDGEDYVYAGDSAAEPVLWTAWTHVGTLRVSINTTMLHVDAAAFHRIMFKSHKLHIHLVEYAVAFVDYMNEADRLTDLYSPAVARGLGKGFQDQYYLLMDAMKRSNRHLSRAGSASDEDGVSIFNRRRPANQRGNGRHTSMVNFAPAGSSSLGSSVGFWTWRARRAIGFGAA